MNFLKHSIYYKSTFSAVCNIRLKLPSIRSQDCCKQHNYDLTIVKFSDFGGVD